MSNAQCSIRGLAIVASVCLGLAGLAPAASIYVDLNALGSGTVGDPTDPFPTLRAGIGASTGDSDVIYVADGVYDDSVEAFSTAGEILLSRSYKIYGGYAGYDAGSGTYDWATRNSRSTVIDLQGTSTRAMHLTGAGYKRPLVDGFTFQNANNGNAGGAVRFAGGFQAGGVINDCLFENNHTTADGGAVYMSTSYNGTATNITNSDFVGNSGRYGGAVYYSPGNRAGTIAGNTFINNSATEAGALHVQSIAVVLQSAFYGNHATGHSGALGSSGSKLTLTVRQSLFDNNSTDGDGAVFGVDHGFHGKTVTFENSVFSDNSGNYALYHEGNGSLTINFSTIANNTGGGVYGKTALTVLNSIVAANGGVGVDSDAAAPVVQYTDVWGQTSDYAGTAVAGIGTLSVDPLFMDPSLDIYQLLAGSPLLAAGDPSASLLVDLLGDLRPQDGGFTLGAYEAAVPEPASISLLAVAGLWIARRGRNTGRRDPR